MCRFESFRLGVGRSRVPSGDSGDGSLQELVRRQWPGGPYRKVLGMQAPSVQGPLQHLSRGDRQRLVVGACGWMVSLER